MSVGTATLGLAPGSVLRDEANREAILLEDSRPYAVVTQLVLETTGLFASVRIARVWSELDAMLRENSAHDVQSTVIADLFSMDELRNLWKEQCWFGLGGVLLKWSADGWRDDSLSAKAQRLGARVLLWFAWGSANLVRYRLRDRRARERRWVLGSREEIDVRDAITNRVSRLRRLLAGHYNGVPVVVFSIYSMHPLLSDESKAIIDAALRNAELRQVAKRADDGQLATGLENLMSTLRAS